MFKRKKEKRKRKKNKEKDNNKKDTRKQERQGKINKSPTVGNGVRASSMEIEMEFVLSRLPGGTPYPHFFFFKSL